MAQPQPGAHVLPAHFGDVDGEDVNHWPHCGGAYNQLALAAASCCGTSTGDCSSREKPTEDKSTISATNISG